MQQVLTTEGVMSLFTECVHRAGEPHDDLLVVQGVLSQENFHKQRIELYREYILAMLAELPESFRTEAGAPFEDAHVDRYAQRWTGLNAMASRLFALGVAIGAVQILGDTGHWPQEGVNPYVRVILQR